MRIIQIVSVLLICLGSIQVKAQGTITPFDATINYNSVERPCIQVNLDPEAKPLKKAWKKYLKDNYDFKLNGIGFLSNKDLLSAEEVTVNQISSKTMDFYTHIVKGENGSEMKLFVRLGYDVYVTNQNYPKEYAALKDILEGFIKYYLPVYYKKEIKSSEKQVNELLSESESLKDDIDKKDAKIVKMREEINEKEEELRLKKLALEKTERELILRKEKLERIKIQLKYL